MLSIEQKYRIRIRIELDVYTYHNRTQYGQLIIKVACLFDVDALESALQTALTHAECHRVHINMIVLHWHAFCSKFIVDQWLSVLIHIQR